MKLDREILSISLDNQNFFKREEENRLGQAWARLCSVVPGSGTEGNGKELMHRKFQLNTRKNFTVQVIV